MVLSSLGMRNILIAIQIAVVIFLARLCSPDKGSSTSAPSDKKIHAQVVSNKKDQEPLLFLNPVSKPAVENSEELVAFVKEIADSRMMDFEEGKLAVKQGTTKEIQSYGKLMVEDQSKMLEEIKSIAERRSIPLEKKISDKKMDELKKIRNLKDRDFDKKFIRMMKIDHRRDIRKLRKASKSKDLEVKYLGTKYLPIVQSHLDKLKHL